MADNIVTLKDGRKLSYADYGETDGIAVFLFHGIPGSRLFHLERDPYVKKYGLRIIAPERPGSGRSDPKPDRTISDWADDVKELADQLGIDQFHIAGGSGGGPYALACAIALPQRVISATLFASATPPDILNKKGMALGNKLAFLTAEYAPLLLKWMFANYANVIQKKPEKFLQKMMGQFCEWDRQVINNARIGIDDHSIIQHLKEAFRQGSEYVYQDFLLISRPWNIAINSLKIPTYLWHGEADTLVPVAPAKIFAKTLPNCESHFINDAGHLLLESDDIGEKMILKMLAMRDKSQKE